MSIQSALKPNRYGGLCSDYGDIIEADCVNRIATFILVIIDNSDHLPSGVPVGKQGTLVCLPVV